MATSRHLKNAPISEALIGIQFEPHVSLETLNVFAEVVKSKFDRQTKIWQQSFGVEFVQEGDSRTSSEQVVIGTRFDSDERKHVVQAKVNGFTFSKLAPYTDWDEINNAAKEMWGEFLQIAKPVIVTRVAVRYINALNIPLPIGDFSEYFTASPQVPTSLPQGISAFLQRVVMIDPQTASVAAVTQALEEPQAGIISSAVTIFLDIDCFQARQMAPNDDELWATLGVLRVFKNTIFFEHITEKTAKLFE